MSARHLLLASDGETIEAVLTMTAEDALLNVGAGSVVQIDPETDPGAFIDNGAVKFDPVGSGLLLIADDSPAIEFDGVDFETIEP